MKIAQKAILDLLAKVGMKSAISAAGTASQFGYCQPKEPEALKHLTNS